ncbi:S46 family peptidase [Niabella insulamsoli]|uniref:S46 family peptidase n=1 Tax=Niabella insulamsoli TaxID=3144874 RepID=UPI0031FD267C
MKKHILLLFVVITGFFKVKADEGMWLPQLLESLNEKRMQSLGMKISASDIYDINKGSLKDAIVSFGGFCTGEVISDQGLLLTNHHCGFDAIQNHSTIDKNFIRDGFWARSKAEELPNAGLFVTFIVRIEDVTEQVLSGAPQNLTESARQSIVDKNARQQLNLVQKESYQNAFIRSFFDGNKYYLFVTETYNDVRLVGAPPSAIGNFGKDTDNWMWPRHTGDFSMFRIYAGKDNKPADYSPENIPYKPKKSLSISMSGMKEGDFTMVFGFPGRTSEYLPSKAVEQIMKVNDPAKILIRDKALKVIDKYMRTDEALKIQYASKYAGISNAWKKWQGEVLGLTNTNAVDKKLKYEAAFTDRVNKNPALQAAYGKLLPQLNGLYEQIKPLALARDYYLETTSKIELFTIVQRIRALNTKRDKGSYVGALKKEIDWMTGFLNELSIKVDKEVFAAMMQLYRENQHPAYVSAYAQEAYKKFGNYAAWAEALYAKSVFADKAKVLQQLKNNPNALFEALQTDEAAQLVVSISNLYDNKVAPSLNEKQSAINQLQRSYMKAQMEVFSEKDFYPDANSTLRVAFGNVKGYQSPTGKNYEYYTYLDGVMKKYKPGDYEFDVPEKLRQLYKQKDFGQYAVNGKVPVCFIASNHTTGGNSGSPALDAYGNLVGLNFDRVWEGTMSDINYDASICRNIMVDIRYILFIVDKFAGASHLVEEMNLVYPKK